MLCAFFVLVFSNKVTQISILGKGSGSRTLMVAKEQLGDQLGVLDLYKFIE